MTHREATRRNEKAARHDSVRRGSSWKGHFSRSVCDAPAYRHMELDVNRRHFLSCEHRPPLLPQCRFAGAQEQSTVSTRDRLACKDRVYAYVKEAVQSRGNRRSSISVIGHVLHLPPPAQRLRSSIRRQPTVTTLTRDDPMNNNDGFNTMLTTTPRSQLMT